MRLCLVHSLAVFGCHKSCARSLAVFETVLVRSLTVFGCCGCARSLVVFSCCGRCDCARSVQFLSWLRLCFLIRWLVFGCYGNYGCARSLVLWICDRLLIRLWLSSARLRSLIQNLRSFAVTSAAVLARSLIRSFPGCAFSSLVQARVSPSVVNP